MRYSRILVPMDFSDDALSAYQVALDQFSGKENTLTLLHVIEPDSLEHEQHNQARFIEDKKRQLHTLGNGHRDQWKEVVALIESGKPTDNILSTAKHENTDLVVMGSHGDGGLTKGLFGSTTYDVARKVKCAVMIIKKPAVKP